MSTAQALARTQLRYVKRVLSSTPVVAESSRLIHSCHPARSAWPVGWAGHEEDDAESSHRTRAGPSSSSATSEASSSSSSSSLARSIRDGVVGSAYSRSRAGPAMEDQPNLSRPPKQTSETHHSSLDPSSGSSQPQGASPDAKPEQRQRQVSKLPPPPRRKTVAYLQKMKDDGIPIACLTAYDYPTALSIRYADVDLCLIGDSLANVALGHSTTQPLSLDAIIHHSQAVQRGLRSSTLLAAPASPAAPLVIADMPFGTFVSSTEKAIENVIRIMQETGVDGVKIEGSEEVIPLIRRLTSFGIPVMGHIGLQPQRVGSTSGYRVQGKSAQQAKDIFEVAKKLQEAGCFSMVLECVPSKLARFISERVDIPTIGIGAGSGTDGQILVMSDMLGELTSPAHVLAGLQDAEGAAPDGSFAPQPHVEAPLPPKFVRSFAKPYSIGAVRLAGVQAYVQAVRDKSFPEDQAEGYKVKSEEWKQFLQLVE